MDLIPEFVATRLAACHPRVRQWQGEEETRTILDRWLREYVDWLSDQPVLTTYAKQCPVEGAQAEEYGIRSLELEGWGHFLAGIHFYGSTNRWPFVHVAATDFLLTPENITPLGSMIQKEFTVFHPKCFRVWIDAEHDPLCQLPGAEIDNWFIAGSLDEIAQTNPPKHHARISLEADPDLKSYEEFAACYAGFHQEHPGTSEWNQAADRGLLEKCVKDGRYYRVHVDGEPAGWIAARVKEEAVLRGWSMMEELLEPPFRGRGLAIAMQRAFLDVLPDRERLIWGTIDPRNVPSMKTALGVGREIVSGYLFLPFP